MSPSHYKSYTNAEMSIHIARITTYRAYCQYGPTLCLWLGYYLHVWSQTGRYDTRPVSWLKSDVSCTGKSRYPRKHSTKIQRESQAPVSKQAKGTWLKSGTSCGSLAGSSPTRNRMPKHQAEVQCWSHWHPKVQNMSQERAFGRSLAWVADSSDSSMTLTQSMHLKSRMCCIS